MKWLFRDKNCRGMSKELIICIDLLQKYYLQRNAIFCACVLACVCFWLLYHHVEPISLIFGMKIKKYLASNNVG